MLDQLQDDKNPVAYWHGRLDAVRHDSAGIARLAAQIRSPLHIVESPDGAPGAVIGGQVTTVDRKEGSRLPLLGILPPLYPEWLGDRAFQETHGCRFPYIVGEMAHGIAGPAMVIAAARAGLLAFLGAAGLGLGAIESMLDEVSRALDPQGLTWGANLIHMPDSREAEDAVIGLYLARGVRRVSASAFMILTPAVVRYAFSGARTGPNGELLRANHVLAKISRPETARLFMTPPAAPIVDALVRNGGLTAEEGALARRHSIAEDVTIEGDSGGHTDNRPLAVIFPRIARLREELARTDPTIGTIRLGAAGGLGTPAAVAAAFALGAAYVLTGSVNQSANESGLSEHARAMLMTADIADVAMAPAADMFEIGTKVQVLKRGTLFAPRANLLYALYRDHDGINSIPAQQRARIEREIFRAPVEEIWTRAKAFMAEHRPAEIDRAERDPKAKMAMIFRWYLGLSARWPIAGETDRAADYQIWCGPALGAFNAWAAGSFLADPHARTVDQIAKNLLEGAATIARAQQLRTMGLAVDGEAFRFVPRILH